VSFEDGTTLSKLDRYVSIISSVASELLEYFSRANELKYFPDDDAEKPWAKLDLSNPESWMKARFSIQVFAYSGIRKGATFNIDVGEKSVNVEGIPVTECVAESERAHDAGDNDDDDLATTLESLKTTIDWNLMTVSKLKDELRRYMLKLGGEKSDLVTRLEKSDRDLAEEEDVSKLKDELRRCTLKLGGKKSDLVTRLEKSDRDLAEEEDAVVSIDETDEDDVEYVVEESAEQVALDDGSAESREQQSTADILELRNGRKLIDATNQDSYYQVRVCMKDDQRCSTDVLTKNMLTFFFFTGFKME
jgi:hypothetical protein